MKMSKMLLLAALALILPAALLAQSATLQMKAVDKESAKVGDILVVTGDNLGKALVEKVYLTDGKDDFVVEIQDQANETIKIKVPQKVKSGRMALMLLTRGKEPKLIEQPVKVTIEE